MWQSIIAVLLDWWSGIGLELQIFYAIGLLATLVVFLQVLLLLFGAGADMDGADGAGDPTDGLHLLSVRTVTAFFMGFGWAGVIALRRGWSLEAAILAALFVGTMFMAAIYFMMRTLFGMRESGTLDYHNAIGQTGVVYVSIPANQTGAGQVEMTVQGRLCFINARTDSDGRIPSGTLVRVAGLADPQTLIVESLSKPASDADAGPAGTSNQTGV